MLSHENEPRRSYLSFERGKPPVISIGVFEPCVEGLSELLGRHRQADDFKQCWGFQHYQSNLRIGFGFDGAIIGTGIVGQYQVLQMPLLRTHTIKGAVSLGLLLSTLRYCSAHFQHIFKKEAPADSNYLQLMELEGGIIRKGGLHAAPLGGEVSPAFVGWIEQVYEERRQLGEVEEVMWLAWNAMSEFKIKKEKGPNPFFGFSLRVGENGSFFLSCPGNACDVSTEDWWGREAGMGHQLGCHNLDTSIQQLTLLAGLAAMHSLAGKDIDSRPPS